MKNKINKTFIFLFTFLVISSLITSCKKDDDNNSNPITPSGPTLKTSVLGTITNTDGLVVPGATVQLGAYTTTSDTKGNFQFINADVPKDRMVLIASKNGYFNCIRAKKTQSGDANYLNLLMEQKPSSINISAVAGGAVNIPGGAKITFPANAFVDASGNTYTGTVKIFARHISPGNDNFEAIVPGGDLIGMNAQGQIQSLYSLGMIDALLFDNSGLNEVKLAPGVTAELKFPIDVSQNGSAQNTITMWHLNSTNGKWMEDGEATKSGNFYIGNVSHFSTWNCDYSGPKTDIQGKVVDCLGLPLPGIVVTINGFQNVTTNNTGTFSTWVPAGYVITCQALTTYNQMLNANSPIQTITAVAGILNIIPDIVASCETRIMGSIKTCDGSQLSPAMIYSSWNGGSSIIYTSTGTYSLYLPPNTKVNIVAQSGSMSGKTSKVTGVLGTTSTAGDILFCNLSTSSKTAFTINSVGGSTSYEVTSSNTTSNFIDTNNDGTFESAYFTIQGIANPGNYNCTINISLLNDTLGNYSLLQGSANHVEISMDSIWAYGSGMPSGNTLNRLTFTDYSNPGGNATGLFEFNVNTGSITNGEFSILRVN